MTASLCEALIGLAPPVPTEALGAVDELLRLVFAIWVVALSTAAADILTGRTETRSEARAVGLYRVVTYLEDVGIG